MKLAAAVLALACLAAAGWFLLGRASAPRATESAAPTAGAAAPEQRVPQPDMARAELPTAVEARVKFAPTARATEGQEDGPAPASTSIELGLKFRGKSAAELEAARAELEARTGRERARLTDERFASGAFVSESCTRGQIGELEARLAADGERERSLCASRCVFPAGSAAGDQGAVEFQSVCLTRADEPALFALLDELEYLRSVSGRVAGD